MVSNRLLGAAALLLCILLFVSLVGWFRATKRGEVVADEKETYCRGLKRELVMDRDFLERGKEWDWSTTSTLAPGSVQALNRSARYCLSSVEFEVRNDLPLLFQGLRGDVSAARGIPAGSISEDDAARARKRAVARADELIEIFEKAGY